MTRAALLCLFLTGCGWDMTAQVWQSATALCESHGGLAAAGSTHISGGDYAVEALCADKSVIRKVVDVRR